APAQAHPHTPAPPVAYTRRDQAPRPPAQGLFLRPRRLGLLVAQFSGRTFASQPPLPKPRSGLAEIRRTRGIFPGNSKKRKDGCPRPASPCPQAADPASNAIPSRRTTPENPRFYPQTPSGTRRKSFPP